VLFNIVKNSVEALHGSGEVRFRTYFDDDGFNVITVSDTGVGMDSETSTRIFQPFFPTKGLETGRGLGMSASHSIVQAHSGSISVKRSAPGYGTVIELRLPAAEADAVAQMVPVVGAPSGSHRVLWVDDDPQIRSLAASYVIAMKHRCDVADGGARALELLGRNDYSVVITYIGMPGMNGMELARHIERKTEGRVPVIALTGWGDSVTADGEPPPGIHRVVAKPIRLKRLKEILDELPTAE
jgi:CheY-like chemotaxis protein